MKESELITKIKNNLATFKNNNSKQHFNLLKWINRLTFHANQEHKYNNKKTKFWSFNRGSIVKVDFGYNVGYEIGGIHYAIVLNNKDSIYSGTLAVIPLTSSKKERKSNQNEIDLGNEFYEHVQNKMEATSRTLNIYNLYQGKLLEELELFEQEFNNNDCVFDDYYAEKFYAISMQLLIEKKSKVNISYLKKKHNEQKAFYTKEVESYKQLLNELSYMKQGTIAKVDQFRTISKSRIVNPRKPHHALNNIKLFDSTLDRINNKLKELYVFDND